MSPACDHEDHLYCTRCIVDRIGDFDREPSFGTEDDVFVAWMNFNRRGCRRARCTYCDDGTAGTSCSCPTPQDNA